MAMNLDVGMFVSSGKGSAILKGLTAVGVIGIIFVMVGVVIYLVLRHKKYDITIELYKKVGGLTQKVAMYKACNFKIGKAGDKLWKVDKIKKFIAPGVYQIAPKVYPYFERSDGEWINIMIEDVEEKMKKAGVKFLHQDMRAQRIAISKMLDSELKDRSFWDKYGATITFILEILIFAVAVVIIFYQFGEVVQKMDQVVGSMNKVVVNINSLMTNFTNAASKMGFRIGTSPTYIKTLET